MSPSATVTGDFAIPTDFNAPLRFEFEEHSLLVGVVLREHISLLSTKDWDVPGLYVLVGLQNGVEPTKVYVEKGAQAGVRKRLSGQKSGSNTGSDFAWWKAIAFVRLTKDGFISAQVGYLEGRLAAELDKMPSLEVSAGKKDQDETLKASQLASLDALMPSLLAGLRVGGLTVEERQTNTEEAETRPESVVKAVKKFYGVTVKEMVEGGVLSPGDAFVGEWHGVPKVAKVTGNGTLKGERCFDFLLGW